MPNWSEVSRQIDEEKSPLDSFRNRYLEIMSEYTGRNVIAYYSAFVQRPDMEGVGIDENDKNAFMQVVYGLDRSKGLDLILHTPGGSLAATESIVYYLKKMFKDDIRAFVPQIAMSAGTMIALSAKEIVMGKQSNLGPIDPQFGGVSCSGIVEEFETAAKEVAADPGKMSVWMPIISKYHPTFIGDCKKAIAWADEIAESWLTGNMFSKDNDRRERARKVLNTLSSHKTTYSHSRHIHGDELKDLGLKIIDLEELDGQERKGCKDLQDCVLTLHHAYMQTLATSDLLKVVENQRGNAMFIGLDRRR